MGKRKIEREAGLFITREGSGVFLDRQKKKYFTYAKKGRQSNGFSDWTKRKARPTFQRRRTIAERSDRKKKRGDKPEKGEGNRVSSELQENGDLPQLTFKKHGTIRARAKQKGEKTARILRKK